eukprot:TRINITY_DN11219_c2_g1_i2.p1 TRINITY_DN11219_c2_g1~~TRINITY_DN11219_c2_g1_i2.p1  ORF type:complete len:331 (-),score=15.07 TRINITY_DN11219_c2_g1_i2:274-1266(-)
MDPGMPSQAPLCASFLLGLKSWFSGRQPQSDASQKPIRQVDEVREIPEELWGTLLQSASEVDACDLVEEDISASRPRIVSFSRRVSDIVADLFDTRVVNARSALHPKRAGGGRTLLGFVSSTTKLKEGRHEECCASKCRAVVEHLFIESMPKDMVEIVSVEYVVNAKLLMRFLRRVSYERASIEATWHGTRPTNVNAILSEGLLASVCNTGAYGRGSYVGTHAGVAHQYADPNDEGLRFMCLVLAVVGSKATKGTKGRKPSTTALDRMVNPTQYCFVEEDRLLVTHLITYRISSQLRTRRRGGGFEDPFQKSLERAVIRAGADVQRGGLR